MLDFWSTQKRVIEREGLFTRNTQLKTSEQTRLRAETGGGEETLLLVLRGLCGGRVCAPGFRPRGDSGELLQDCRGARRWCGGPSQDVWSAGALLGLERDRVCCALPRPLRCRRREGYRAREA